MNTKTCILSLALLCGLPAAAQQSLSTEVVVDRTVEPAERAAVRPAGLYPRLVLPAARRTAPSTASYEGYGAVDRMYTPLGAIAEPGLPAASPYRGYAMLGYFPVYNLGVSAGYRILDTERTRLGVWGQFDGTSYKAPACDDARMRYKGGRIGASLRQAFGAASRLDVKLSGGYATYRSAAYDSQSLGSGELSAVWSSRAGRVDYSAGIRGFIDSYGDIAAADGIPATDGPAQQQGGFEAAAAYDFDGASRAGLEAAGDWLHSSVSAGSPTLGIVRLTPYYSYSSRQFAARLGAEVDLLTGGTGGKVHVAPSVMVSWTPAGTFAMYLTARGGDRLNALRTLREYTPYLPGLYAAGRSQVPVDATIGFNVGPLKGLAVGVFASYASASDAAMPMAATVAPVTQTDVKALRGGIEASYAWRTLVRVSARAEFAQSSASHAWYEWLDRASSVVSASLEVTPLERLAVRVTYDWRGGRRILLPREGTASLGCVSDLGAGATYGITPAIDVFTRVDNILGRRHMLLPGIESRGLHGLAGVQLKF